MQSPTEELQHFLKTEDEESSGLKEHINGIHHKTTPPVDSIIQHTKPAVQPKLSTMCEEENEDDIMEEPWDTELSAEAQAHNISMFLSTSTSSDSGTFCDCVILVQGVVDLIVSVGQICLPKINWLCLNSD